MFKTGMYRLFIILCFFFSSIQGKSQSSSFTKNYYVNQMLINPAITGLDYSYKLASSYNNQWIGISNSPSTYFVAGQIRLGEYDFYDPKEYVNKSRFKTINRVGLGGGLYYDKYGPLSQFMTKLSYAYHIPFDETELSFGLSGSLSQSYLNSSIIHPREPNDMYLQEEQEYPLKLNFDLGVFYSHFNYFIGLSLINIIPEKESVDYITQIGHGLYFIGGYLFMGKNKSFAYEPTILIKKESVSEMLMFDLHNKFYIAKYNWITISYKEFNKLCFQLAIKTGKTLYIGYSYEYTISQISSFNIGTHGIMFGMNLGMRKTELFL